MIVLYYNNRPMGELGLAWGERGLDVFATFVLRFNLTRDLSRSVPMVIRSPTEPYLMNLFTIFETFGFYIVLPVELPTVLPRRQIIFRKSMPHVSPRRQIIFRKSTPHFSPRRQIIFRKYTAFFAQKTDYLPQFYPAFLAYKIL